MVFLKLLSYMYRWIILGMGSANERLRYDVALSLIGWAHTQAVPCSNSGNFEIFHQRTRKAKYSINKTHF